MLAASHELLDEDVFAATAAAQAIPTPASAGQNLTANSLHPKNFSDKADSYHESIAFPAARASPILGTK